MIRVRIEPLSSATLEETCALAKYIFDDEVESPDVEIRHSLQTKQYIDGFTHHHIVRTDYWVAVSENTSDVVGFIGLYEHDFDAHESAWIGWYGIHPNFRGEGIGSRLLVYAREEAKNRGKAFLRVYTSTYFAEKEALEMYKRKGFTVTSSEPYIADISLDILYLECNLDEKISVK